MKIALTEHVSNDEVLEYKQKNNGKTSHNVPHLIVQMGDRTGFTKSYKE